MSDLRTGAIEVTEEALARNPELRALVQRLGGEATEAGVRVVPRSAEDAARLQRASEAVGLSTPPSGASPREVVDPARQYPQMTGGPVPPDRALAPQSRPNFEMRDGAPGHQGDEPFHIDDTQWGEHRPSSGFGVDAESADRPQLSLPAGAREQHITDMGLTDPVFRRGLGEQLKYAEHLKGAPLNAEEMQVETRKFTNTFDRGEQRPFTAEPPTASGAESKSSGFDESLERGMGNVGEVANSRGLTTREKLGIGAAGLAATGYAAHGASGSWGADSSMAARAAPPATAAGEMGPPSSARMSGGGSSTSSGAAAADATAAGARADHISGAVVRAEQIKKDPAFLNKEIGDLDTELGKIAGTKKDITPEDEAAWKKQRAELLQFAREARQTNDWAEVAERLGHAITQMGAAMAGLRTGVDMSGLKFDKTDWRAKNEQIMAELKQGLDVQEKDETGTRKTIGDARAAFERIMENKRRAAEKKGEYEHGVDAANTEARNKAAAETARNQQSAAEANLQSDNQGLNRDSNERISEGREDRDAKRAQRAVHTASAKADYDLAAKQAKALQDAAGIIATTKGKRELYDRAQLQIGKALGDAGLGTDWADAQAKASDANSIGDGKDDADFLLEDLKRRAEAAVRLRDEKHAAWSQMETGGDVAPPAAARSIVKKEVNQQTKQTRFTYSDGTTQVVNGIQ